MWEGSRDGEMPVPYETLLWQLQHGFMAFSKGIPRPKDHNRPTQLPPWMFDVIPRVVLEDEEDDLRWGFKCGLVLRAISVTKVVRERFPMGWTAAFDEQLEWLKEECIRYIRVSMVNITAGIEVKTSYDSAETNTESQPWAAIGLHADQVEASWRDAAEMAFQSRYVAAPLFSTEICEKIVRSTANWSLSTASVEFLKELEVKYIGQANTALEGFSSPSFVLQPLCLLLIVVVMLRWKRGRRRVQ